MSDLRDSGVVGDWREPLQPVFICPPPELHDFMPPCDCGYVGLWEYRTVYVWSDAPGYQRGDRLIRRDLARGWPPRSGDEGFYVIAGYDERCPGCGDIERIDEETGEVVSQSAEHANVVSLSRFNDRGQS